MKLLSLVAALALGTAISAQSCSDLTVTGDGMPGTTLSFSVTGAAAEKPAILFIGETTGTTTIEIGMLGTLELGLAMPFVPVPMGRTDANGDVQVDFDIPASSSIPSQALNAQASTVDFQFGGGRPSLDFCTSDVEGFNIGS